ncbi:galectin [Kalaharituber pfeilii]|nr:galectin [Kalaharituber pfeilii]
MPAFYLLKLGGALTLSNAVQADGIVIFQSAFVDVRSCPVGDNTSFNLLNRSGDCLLHITFRRPKNVIVFNARRHDGGWGSQESIPLAGAFKTDGLATVTVYDHGDRYQILIDGRTVHYFQKRFHDAATQVSYGTDASPPPFSDPVAVTQFQNIGELSAGRV